MSTYTQFYVLPVQKSKLDAYRQFAVDTGKIWLELGALGYAEFIADDVKSGVHTSFPQAVKLGSEETVVVAQVTFPSREECDRIAMAFRTDPRMTAMDFKSVPVDGTRMFWGGFKPFVGETAATPDGASAIQPYLFFRGRCEEAVDFGFKVRRKDTRCVFSVSFESGWQSESQMKPKIGRVQAKTASRSSADRLTPKVMRAASTTSRVAFHPVAFNSSRRNWSRRWPPANADRLDRR